MTLVAAIYGETCTLSGSYNLCTATVGKLVAFAAIKGNSKGAQVAANKRPPLQMTNLL